MPRKEPISNDEFLQHLFVAAVYTNALSTVKKLLADEHGSALVGGRMKLIAAKSNHEMLDLLLRSRGAFFQTSRGIILSQAAINGRSKETLELIYNCKIDTVPWAAHARNTLDGACEALRRSLATPHREAWDYILELGKSYPAWLSKKLYLSSYLSRSVQRGWTEMTAHLLQLGACVNSGHGLPLLTACKGGFVETVQVLLEHDIHGEFDTRFAVGPHDVYDVNVPLDTTGAIAAAASNGHTALVQKLLEHGAETTDGLARAAAGGYMDIVQLLLEHGADPNAHNGEVAPIVGALEMEHTAMFRLLLEHGAVVASPETAHECVRRVKEAGLESMLELLRESGVDTEYVPVSALT
jgi:hypothetical protein